MLKFRKRPVVIEAEQFVQQQPIPRGVCFCWNGGAADGLPHLHTIHKGQRVNVEFGDWIIPEPDGEHFYTCKPDIFAATYERVSE